MKNSQVIKPDVLNIFCRDPQQHQRVNYEARPTSESKPDPKKTFWGKARGFFQKAKAFLKEAASFLTPVVTLLGITAAIVNSVGRLRGSDVKSGAWA